MLFRSMGLTPKEHGGELDNYPIYALDLPGHGKSGGESCRTIEEYADSINEFIKAIELKNTMAKKILYIPSEYADVK